MVHTLSTSSLKSFDLSKQLTHRAHKQEQSNTFQTVLALSDGGRQSHVLFYYDNGVMNWPGDGPYAVVGFSAGDGVHSFILPTSGTEQVLQVTETGNTVVSGGWVFRVDGEDVIMRGLCVCVCSWYYKLHEVIVFTNIGGVLVGS